MLAPAHEGARNRSRAGPIRDPRAAFPFKRCQDLLKPRLTKPVRDLFHEFTGLSLHVRWHTPVAARQRGDLPRLCPRLRGRSHFGVAKARARQRPAGQLPARCQTCLRTRWQPAWNTHETQKRFGGLCGSLNYRAAPQVPGSCPVTLLVQQPLPAPNRGSGPVSRADHRAFRRAVNLTRLIIHDLEATLEARRVADELDRVRKRVKAAVSNEDARPRPVLPLGGPAIPKTRKQPTCGNHPRQIVQRMLDYIHQHYCRPMQLGDLAEAMNMNAAYLSDLFHTALGVTFHHYLEQLRLAKARELLRNPVNRVCEVACAVGYVNPNHFREVFKAHVGVSPSAWRETVGM